MPGRFSRRSVLGVFGGAAATVSFARRAAAAPSVAPTAGGLVTLARPIRVFDSRVANVLLNGAKLESGHGIAVSVADAFQGESFVRAVFVNCTITQTEGSGYLIIFAADPSGKLPDPDTSNINWPTSGLTLANLVLAPVGQESSIDIRCEGGGRTHLILDVQGYVPENIPQ